jgi:hypothetical protein
MGGSSAAIGPTENSAICSKTAAKRIAFLIICFSCAFHSKILGPLTVSHCSTSGYRLLARQTYFSGMERNLLS